MPDTLVSAPVDARRKWLVLAVAGLATALVWIDVTAVNLAVPDLERSFSGASRSELSWVLDAYNVVFAALLVPAGRLADALGRKRTFLAGLAIFAASSLACAAAPSVGLLVGARVAQAIGAAAMVPAGFALVLAAFPVAQLARAVGLWVAIGGVSSALGPPVGGSLIDAGSWRWIFLLNLPITLVAIAVGARLLDEARAAERRLPDLAGAVLLAGGLGCLAIGIVQGREWGWDSVRVLAAFAAAPLLIALVLRRSARHPVPVLALDLLALPRFALANLGTLILATGFFAGFLCNVLFLTSVWGYSELGAGLAIAPGPLAVAVVATQVGRAVGRFGALWVAVGGVLICVAGIAWLAVVPGAEPDYVAAWLPGQILFGIGIGLGFPAFGSTAVRLAPASAFALATGINTTARQLGAVLGVAILVAVVGRPAPADALGVYQRGLVVSLAISAAALLAAIAMPARQSAPAPG